MHRLAGEDAGFLYMELPIQPTNTMAMGILRPATSPDGQPEFLTLDDVRAHMAFRLGELPSFRWRVERVPFNLHHPVYIRDPDFDLDYHLRETTVAAPGGRKEVDAVFAHLAEHRLDRRHPLWQLWLIHGLADDRQAIIVKVNHCMMDGVGALTTFSRIFSGTDHQVVTAAEPWEPEPVPRPSRLIVDALRDHGRRSKELPALIMKTQRNFRALKAYEPTASVPVPKPLVDSPPSAFNDAFTVQRSYFRAQLALDDIKLVKDAAGVSLNDVALATVAGAARRYLLARDQLPDRSLTASVPIGFDTTDDPNRQWGNRFSSLTTSLATDEADPWKRLQIISQVTAEAKRGIDVFGPELMPDWLEFVPPFVAVPAIAGHHRSRRDDRNKVDVNILISNLRGPSQRWSFGSAGIDELNLSGPPTNGVGSNVMMWSYADHLILSVLSFADAMRDPYAMATAIDDSLAELVKCANEANGASARAAGQLSR